jgi:nicotinamidase-related amidase
MVCRAACFRSLREDRSTVAKVHPRAGRPMAVQQLLTPLNDLPVQKRCMMGLSSCSPPAEAAFSRVRRIHEDDVLARQFSADRTGLLLVDTFNDFLSQGGKLWSRIQPAAVEVDLLDHLRALLSAVRRAGASVIHVPHRRWREGDFDRWKHPTPWQLQIDREALFAFGTWGGDWHPDLAPRPGDVIVQEHWGHDGFHNTDLDLQLRQRGIESIVVAGMPLNGCVAATARSGIELGYHVTIVRDATVPLDLEFLQAKQVLGGPPFAHAISTTDEFVAFLDAQAT